MRIAMEGEKLVVYDESEFYPVHYNDMEDGHLILRTVWELPLYSQPDTESSIVTLPADAIITPISASPLGWLELRAESGETGYYLVNEEQALPGGGYLYDLLSDEFEWHD